MDAKARQSMFLRHMTVEQLDEHIFKHYNYNGIDAHQDLALIASAEKARKATRNSAPIWLGMTAFSGYNMTRMGVLSASGRIGAITGLAIGSFMTFSALNTKV